jgi:DNA-binding NarL/FixJ family response regulator
MNSCFDTRVSITSAEVKVLTMMRQGLTNREIALRLDRSVFTVKTHVEHILAKTGARNRAHACAIIDTESTT